MPGVLDTCPGIVQDQGKHMRPASVMYITCNIFINGQYGAEYFAGGHDGAVDPDDFYGCNGRGWEKLHTMAQVTLLWNNSGTTQMSI